MSAFDNLTTSQKIRAAVHRDVCAISAETCHFLGLEMTKPAMEIIAELVYKKLSIYGADLEAFAKHAKRTAINADDVKLLVRRNPSLLAHLNNIVPATTQTTKRRKTTVKPQETLSKTTEVVDQSKEDKRTEQKEEENKKTDNIKAVTESAFEDMSFNDITIDLTFD